MAKASCALPHWDTMLPLRSLARATAGARGAGLSRQAAAPLLLLKAASSPSSSSLFHMAQPATTTTGALAGAGPRGVPARGFMAAAAAAAGDGKDKVVMVEDFKAFTDQTTQAERAIAYFTASWCPPCRTISPIYASLSTKHPGVAFLKIDVDANEEAASKSNIRTIPAFYFYRKGKVIGKLVGADQKKLVEQIEDLEATP